MAHDLNLALAAGTVVFLYVTWIRSILRRTPALRTLFATETSRLAAIKLKFAGIKQRLTSAILVTASAVVELYDHIVPHLTGVDVTPLTSHVPGWAWPVICVGGLTLIDYFRELADQRKTEEAAPIATEGA
jgi:hypothetical protein